MSGRYAGLSGAEIAASRKAESAAFSKFQEQWLAEKNARLKPLRQALKEANAALEERGQRFVNARKMGAGKPTMDSLEAERVMLVGERDAAQAALQAEIDRRQPKFEWDGFIPPEDAQPSRMQRIKARAAAAVSLDVRQAREGEWRDDNTNWFFDAEQGDDGRWRLVIERQDGYLREIWVQPSPPARARGAGPRKSTAVRYDKRITARGVGPGWETRDELFTAAANAQAGEYPWTYEPYRGKALWRYRVKNAGGITIAESAVGWASKGEAQAEIDAMLDWVPVLANIFPEYEYEPRDDGSWVVYVQGNRAQGAIGIISDEEAAARGQRREDYS